MHQKRTVNYCSDFVVNLMRKFKTTVRIPSYNSSLNNSTLQSSVSMAFGGKQFEKIPLTSQLALFCKQRKSSDQIYNYNYLETNNSVVRYVDSSVYHTYYSTSTFALSVFSFLYVFLPKFNTILLSTDVFVA